MIAILTLLCPQLGAADDEPKAQAVTLGTMHGELANGDAMVDSGEYFDMYSYTGKASENLLIQLSSNDFDTYLIVIGQDGKQYDNDDIEARKNLDSQVIYQFKSDGTIKIACTSARKAAKGKYLLKLSRWVAEKPEDPDSKPEAVVSNPIDGEYKPEALKWPEGKPVTKTVIEDKLEEGDSKIGLKYIDFYNIDVTRGELVTVTLIAEKFDAFLMMVTPEGYLISNDDIEERINTDSHIVRHAMRNGKMRIAVTSTYEYQKGKYKLYVVRCPHSLPVDAPKIADGSVKGRIDGKDFASTNNRRYEIFKFQGSHGTKHFIQLNSTTLDPLLFVVTPSGFRLENDDIVRGVNLNSRIEFEVAEEGTHYLGVAAIGSDSEGDFVLRFETGSVASRGVVTSSVELETGEHELELERKDGSFEQKKADFFHMELQRGGYFKIEMRSEEFLPALVLQSPSGRMMPSYFDMDTRSRSAFYFRTLETGRYHLIATSQHRGAIGKYDLDFSKADFEPRTERISDSVMVRELTANDERYIYQRVKWFSIAGRKNDALTMEATSEAFDPMLIFATPQGRTLENDDFTSGESTARISVRLDVDGEFLVGVTSYRPQHMGEFRLSVRTGTLEFPRLSWGTTIGELGEGDLVTEDERFVDFYQFAGHAGATAIIEMNSDLVDPFIRIKSPSGEEFVDDDSGSDSSDAALTIKLKEDGIYTLQATTYKREKRGKYSILFRLTGIEKAVLEAGKPIENELGEKSTLTHQGLPIDWYRFDGIQGRWANIRLSATDFDTFLVILTPQGERIENDNYETGSKNSGIRYMLSEGLYQVGVTSQASAKGRYVLSLDFEKETTPQTRKPITIGQQVVELLQPGDKRMPDGRYTDEYTLAVNKGQKILVDLRSPQFDTQLVIITPGGKRILNDDISQTNKNSRLLIESDIQGELVVQVLPYTQGSTGSYVLKVELAKDAPEAGVVRLSGSNKKNRKFYGIFVGISDYPSVMNDLRFCKEDATKLSKTFKSTGLMEDADQVLLTDTDATKDKIKQAFELMASKVGKDDVFVFFYSGHGIQSEVDKKHTDEIDRRQESLFVYDGQVQDDTMAGWFDKIKCHTAVVIIDCCFAGGFRRDIISEPGRVGFFSSEEDLTSAVAAKFSAGGYLSFFFTKAIEGSADLNRDGIITFGELSHYIQSRYAKEVTSQYAESSEGAKAYQHLVVDRGSITVDTTFIYK